MPGSPQGTSRGRSAAKSRRRRHGVNIPTRQPLRQRVRREPAFSLRLSAVKTSAQLLCASLAQTSRDFVVTRACVSASFLRAQSANDCPSLLPAQFPTPSSPAPAGSLAISRGLVRRLGKPSYFNLGLFFLFHSRYLQFGFFFPFFLPLFLFSVFPIFRYVKGLRPNEISPFRGLTIPPPK